MKKRASVLISIISLFLSIFILVSCGENKDDSNVTSTNTMTSVDTSSDTSTNTNTSTNTITSTSTSSSTMTSIITQTSTSTLISTSTSTEIITSTSTSTSTSTTIVDNYYTITFKNFDGTILQSSSVKEGTIPSYDGIPSMAKSAEYTYVFNGWNPNITIVEEDCEYVATYEAIKNKYTYTFYDEDGISILKEETIDYGATIIPPSNPNKENDAQYTYTFDGWYTLPNDGVKVNEFGTITNNISFYARYEVIINKYTVTWKNFDGETLEIDSNVEYGSIPEYNGIAPTKPQDDTYNYIFNGWNPNVSKITGDKLYTATFISTLIPYYTITFEDYDGTVLQSSSLKEGEIPLYNKSNPSRDNDDNYSYEFAGWIPAVINATKDETYKASYLQQDLPYIVTINLDGGTSSLSKLQFKTDKISKEMLPFDVKKKGYAFKGYELNNIKVYDENGNAINDYQLSSNMSFKAIYEEAITLTILYTIYNPKTNTLIDSFDNKPNDIGNVSETRSYHYNTYVDLFAKPDEGYAFIGWYNEGQVLSNEKDYKYMMWDEDFTIEARFKYTLYELNVWPNNTDLGQVMIRNGNSQTFYNDQTLNEYYTESVTIVAYSKTDTRFLGWYDEKNELVSTNAVYTFDMLNRDYTLEAKWNSFDITYYLDGGVNNSSNPTKYNVDMQNITLLNPTKEGYTFAGWQYKGNIITSINTSNICHMELKALWNVNTNTPYKVEHYLQNIDNTNYPSTPFGTDNLTGTTDTLTNGNVKTYQGFTSPSITQVNINGNGNTVIKLYYTRNSYTVTLNKSVDKAGTITGTGTYKYEKEITIQATTNPGYTFIGWYDGENEISTKLSYTFTIPASNLSYTAKWNANTNTPYKVEHYLQNIEDDNYPETPFEVDNLSGTTDTLTNGEVNIYEGFVSPSVTQVNIDGNEGTILKLYYVRNKYNVYLSKNIDKAGTITGNGIYKYGKEITINATENQEYNFCGWFRNNELYSSDLSFNYTIGALNIRFEAMYTVNKYTIDIQNQEEIEIFGISSGEKYDFDSQIIIKTSISSSAFTIKWVRNDGSIYSGDEYSFIVPPYDLTITVIKIPRIYFGTYPQTLVEDDALITELNSLAGTTPTSDNLYDWTDYNYYISSSIPSYMFYYDIDYDNNGTHDYRGVYFTHNRPDFSPDIYNFGADSQQLDNGYQVNTTYWFKYEPIEWNILNESSEKILIIANLVIDSQQFYPSDSNNKFSHNGGIGYANNYELSNIRKWLNDNFYKTAFSDLQRQMILTTCVDNSLSSTDSVNNIYTCNDTYDKIFLLSSKEIQLYYPLRIRRLVTEKMYVYGTDYAKCQGLNSNSLSRAYYWLLRTPSKDLGSCVTTIIPGGTGFEDRGSTATNYYGIRPACYVTSELLGNI